MKNNLAQKYNKFGIKYHTQNKLTESIEYFEKGLDIEPNNAEIHYNLSFSLLLSGEFVRGWEEYEWRLLIDSYRELHDFSTPYWKDQDLSGKSILVFAEGGAGDIIWAARYIPLLTGIGAKVIFCVRRTLMKLLKGLSGVDQFLACDDLQPSFDYYCLSLSLPHSFKTTLETIPATVPYILPEPSIVEVISEKCKHITGLKVGICWKTWNSKRSATLSFFLKLFDVPNVTFFCIQHNGREEFLEATREVSIFDFGYEIDKEAEPFVGKAALINNLDLIITCDTSIAHLAGALGRQVWVFLPFNPAFYFLLEQNDNPWYPTMRVFRQPSPGDWESVFIQIAKELSVLTVKRSKTP